MSKRKPRDAPKKSVTLKPGTQVRVKDPKHWLFDQVGVVRQPSLGVREAARAVVAENRPVGIVVDFFDKKEGWVEQFDAVRKAHTHNCRGSLSSETGYLFTMAELEVIEGKNYI